VNEIGPRLRDIPSIAPSPPAQPRAEPAGGTPPQKQYEPADANSKPWPAPVKQS